MLRYRQCPYEPQFGDLLWSSCLVGEAARCLMSVSQRLFDQKCSISVSQRLRQWHACSIIIVTSVLFIYISVYFSV